MDSMDGTTSSFPRGADRPRDAIAIAQILRSMGIEEFEEGVVFQYLEFLHRYTSEILEEAQIFANHANRMDVTRADVELAIQSKVTHSFLQPPSTQSIIALAAEKNKTPLPPFPRNSIVLPPIQDCFANNSLRVLHSTDEEEFDDEDEVVEPQQQTQAPRGQQDDEADRSRVENQPSEPAKTEVDENTGRIASVLEVGRQTTDQTNTDISTSMEPVPFAQPNGPPRRYPIDVSQNQAAMAAVAAAVASVTSPMASSVVLPPASSTTAPIMASPSISEVHNQDLPHSSAPPEVVSPSSMEISAPPVVVSNSALQFSSTLVPSDATSPPEFNISSPSLEVSRSSSAIDEDIPNVQVTDSSALSSAMDVD